MKHTATAFIVALPLVCAAVAVAGLPTGIFVSQNNMPTGVFKDNDVPAPTFGNYKADLLGYSIPGISADLNWFDGGSNFQGTCTGKADEGSGAIIGRSQTITLVTLTSISNFSINYAMSGVVNSGNEISWGLNDLGSENPSVPVFGLAFNGTSATNWGGVSTASSVGSFSGSVGPGTYLLIMLAECRNTGGTFFYDATFTPVPAPGAIPAILMAAALRGRRRR
jgi:hypothetical protein